jgi:thiol:disulfide interchange protein
MYEFLVLLALLLFGHFSADFSMQNELQGLGKNRHSNPFAGAVPWGYCLTASGRIAMTKPDMGLTIKA